MSRPILLAVFGDLHCNSRLGLCPPEGVKFREGAKYLPSKAQRWLWRAWEDYEAWVLRLRGEHKAKLYAVCNGDAVDGLAHHNQSQFVAAEEDPMMYIAHRTLENWGALTRRYQGKRWMMRGTRSHVGSIEELLGHWWKAEREPETDAWSRYVLKLNLYGVTIDIRHHAPTGTTRTWPPAVRRWQGLADGRARLEGSARTGWR